MFMYSALDRIFDKLEVWPEHIQNLTIANVSERLGRKICAVWGERYEDVIMSSEMTNTPIQFLSDKWKIV